MAYTTIDKPSDYFVTKLYNGSDSAQSITGLDFQPDWVWLKRRSSVRGHTVYDAPRGATYGIYPDLSDKESVGSSALTAFTSDGFSLGADDRVSGSGHTYVSWNWEANGAGASNTAGSINTTKTSASTTSGFSIVTYTGTGSNATLGHGLGIKPSVIMIKNLETNGEDWAIYNEALGYSKYLKLNATTTVSTNTNRFNAVPTTSLINIGAVNETNQSSKKHVAYCFANIQGFSKMGTYIGNGNADGAFVYTGFKPAWVLLKNTAATEAYFLFDNKRGVNGAMVAAFPDETAADGGAADNIDLLSNGFKLRASGAIVNSAAEFFYMAFAENPFVTSSGVPGLAR